MLELDLPYKSSTMQLRLEVNAALFSTDWYAASWDDAGELVVEDNAEDYMCLYLGSVVGMPDSIVALSVCDDMGIQGRIASSDAGLDLGVRATDSSLRSITNVGEHVIYNMTLAMEDLSFEGEAEFVDDGSNRPEGEMPGLQSDVATDTARSGYMNNVVFASFEDRLGQFSSDNQERSVTQSIVNIALSYYRDSNSKWIGDPPRHAIRSQVQDPSGCEQTSGGILGKCVACKESSHRGAFNVPATPLASRAMRTCAGPTALLVPQPRQMGTKTECRTLLRTKWDISMGSSMRREGLCSKMFSTSLFFEAGAVGEWTDRRDNYDCLQ
jgi:hypothetical protein